MSKTFERIGNFICLDPKEGIWLDVTKVDAVSRLTVKNFAEDEIKYTGCMVTTINSKNSFEIPGITPREFISEITKTTRGCVGYQVPKKLPHETHKFIKDIFKGSGKVKAIHAAKSFSQRGTSGMFNLSQAKLYVEHYFGNEDASDDNI